VANWHFTSHPIARELRPIHVRPNPIYVSSWLLPREVPEIEGRLLGFIAIFMPYDTVVKALGTLISSFGTRGRPLDHEPVPRQSDQGACQSTPQTRIYCRVSLTQDIVERFELGKLHRTFIAGLRNSTTEQALRDFVG
jgi:hypothetical protein